MNKQIVTLGAAVALAVMQSATAAPIDASTLNLTELQNLLNSKTLGGTSSINVSTEEAQAERFAFQSTGATSTYIATVSYAYPVEFGLYDVYNSNTKVALFDTTSGSQAGDSTQIAIQFNAAGNTVTTYFWDSSCPFPGVCVVDSASFLTTEMGFYATSVYGTFYSESDKNAADNDANGDGVNDDDHFLTYMGEGDMVQAGGTGAPYLNDFAHWYIAVEATHLGDPSSNDYTDFVVQLESLQPVAEPETLALFGAGLLGLAAFARRKKRA
jgi:hypothetical protein